MMVRLQRNISSFAVAAILAVCVGSGSTYANQDGGRDGKWKESAAKAAVLFKAGRVEEAIEIARQAVASAEEEFGKDDNEVVAPLLSLGTMLLMKGETEEFEKVARRAYDISKSSPDADRAQLATTLKYLGALYMQTDQLDKAEEVYLEAVKLSEETVGPDHPETAKHLGNLGALYLKRDDVEKGRGLIKRALAIWDRQPEPHPVYTVGEMTNLAASYLKEGRHDEALELYRKGMEIQEAAFGKHDPRLLNGLTNYAAALREAGRTEEAGRIQARIDSMPVTSEPPRVNASILAKGKAAWDKGTCIKCHGEDGTGGKRAPNLTDDKWIHCDGSVEGILRVLKSGVKRDQFADPNRPFEMNSVTNLVPDPEDLAALAEYVHSLSREP